MIRKRLRSTPTALTNTDIEKMIRQHKFNHPHAGIIRNFKPKFKVKTSKGKKVVIDRKFAILWDQSGTKVEIDPSYRLMSDMNSIDTTIINSMSWKQAKKYIGHLNAVNYAGYSDWRMPTMEELMSLMNDTKGENGLYFSTEFDAEQDWCWSGDNIQSDPEVFYGVDFRYGSIDIDCLGFDTFVRGVRSN